MHNIPDALADDFAAGCTTKARLLKIVRQDGVVLRFTDATFDLLIAGDGVYQSAVSFETTSVMQSVKAQSVTITVGMDQDGVSESDLRLGRYLFATFTLMACNYAAPGHGVMILFQGLTGRTQITDKNRATIEVTPYKASIANIGWETFGFTCRNVFGDKNCKVDVLALAKTFAVTTAPTSRGSVFSAASLSQSDGAWDNGTLIWSGGLNQGWVSKVLTSTAAGQITLTNQPLNTISRGDSATIYPGCNKTRGNCVNPYNNLVNFRGEADIPLQLSFTINAAGFGSASGA